MAKESNCERILQNINAVPRLRQAQVFLLQEVAGEPGKPSVAEQVAARLGYSVVFASEAENVHDRGLAILSVYPLTDLSIRRLPEYDQRFHSRRRFAIAATAHLPTGDIRVWNTHLDTRLNAAQRLGQLRPVIEEAARFKGPRLIGGDFNTNDLYWIGNVFPFPWYGPAHTASVRKAMHEKGFQTPFNSGVVTFSTFRRQLDWLFMAQLQSLDCSVEPVAFSDHHAIWSSLRLPN